MNETNRNKVMATKETHCCQEENLLLLGKPFVAMVINKPFVARVISKPLVARVIK